MLKQKTIIHPDFEHLRHFIQNLPYQFHKAGITIHEGRNELRLYEVDGYSLVVKSYKRPHILNRIIYGFIRASKAERAYRYGLKLLNTDFNTPQPVGYVTCRRGLLLDKSYSVTIKSDLPYTFKDFSKQTFKRQDEILKSIALYTARLHEAGFLHKDYSAGNILFDDIPNKIPIEIVDLNRIIFRKVNMRKGCKNFERLPGNDHMLNIMATTYAKARGYDAETCFKLIKKYVQIELETRKKQLKKDLRTKS